MPVLGTLGLHAFRAGRALPDSRLFDRLLRGRAWVVLLGVLLIGLVALNVSLLKLNAQAGRNAETAKALRVHNNELRAKVSRLASGERLQRVGRQLGLAMSSAGRVRYVSIGRADAKRAARALASPTWTVGFTFPPLPTASLPALAAQTAPAAPTPPAAGTTGPGAQTQPAAGVPAGAGTPATRQAQPASGVPAQPQAQPPAAGGAQPAAGAGPPTGN